MIGGLREGAREPLREALQKEIHTRARAATHKTCQPFSKKQHT